MDSNHQSNCKLSKTEKKLLRKQIKARHTLLRHEGIETVSYATQSLIVANGGLGNQVSRNRLLPVLEKCGLVDALLMPPNKPYSCVRYKTVEESKKAYDTLNGKEIVDDLGQKISLYLNFVEKVQKSLKHRRVKHFGYEFHYENNSVDKDKPLPGGLPDICESILEKWLKEGFIKHKPDQLTINQYEPGHGEYFFFYNSSHKFHNLIVMDFKHPDGMTVPVMLPRRSLLVMTGESRYLWTHGQMKEPPASFPESDKEALQLEQDYVHRVYEEIARHFSSTRHTPWPHIVEFLKALPSGSLVADIGCGNGKYLGINKELYMERRVAALQELVRLLRPGGKALIYVWAMEQEYNKKKSKYLRENRTSQGMKEEISNDTSVQELLVKQLPNVGNQDSAHSVSSINDFQDGGYNSRNVANSKLPVHTNRTSFHSQDLLVPWHLKENPGKDKHVEPFGSLGSRDPGPVFHRYYHVFCEGELEAACQTLSNISILQSYYDQGNWCVILQKV
ncbi:hypothetical protein FD755_017146 [Muntiacus reevesi]|uniref:tRNA (carboxymethyluridine(34)-5-O)-methyltransferase ALKBH8 n=1 Tax=Muntiacus reevesi TaxID=9886 RepID=A0A5N3XC02_MUNRE|nr:hypothetical protein FD755_017146 [Muntiacus reevesi]